MNNINYKNKKARELFLEALKIDKMIEEEKENEEEKEKLEKEKEKQEGKNNSSKLVNLKKIKDLEYESELRKTLADAIEEGIIDEDEVQI